MANEIEVKLIAPPELVSSIKEMTFDGVISTSPWSSSHLENTYFDTDSFKLRELRIGLRIRKDGEQYIQTVKSSGKAIGGLHQRNESESLLPEPELDKPVEALFAIVTWVAVMEPSL